MTGARDAIDERLDVLIEQPFRASSASVAASLATVELRGYPGSAGTRPT
jgi:hypothetical protein